MHYLALVPQNTYQKILMLFYPEKLVELEQFLIKETPLYFEN